MAGKAKHAWPSHEELLGLVRTRGQDGTARWLGVTRSAVQHRLRKAKRKGLEQTRQPGTTERPPIESEGVQVNGSTVTVTMPVTEKPELGDYATLLRERGLNPEEWVVVSVRANEWDAMAAVERGTEPRLVRMRQWSITLKPAVQFLLAAPAVHVPVVRRTRVGPPACEKPETIVVEGDHQVPYHDPRLHEASLQMLKDLTKSHRLAEHVFLGDTGDYPTISRHDDHPAAMADVNEVTQGVYNLLREKREAAPNIRVRKMKGNHDWRVDSELLKRAERMYDIRPAQRWEDNLPELPALHLNRLLHLDQLGIEFIEDPRGWQHAEVELVEGVGGLVVRHGWLTGANTAKTSLTKRGRSIIVGHIHKREHVFLWDPSAGLERQGVVAGTMSLTRDKAYPHYTTLESWLAGCVIVTRWPDSAFSIEHARWDGSTLRWRDYCWQG